MKHSHQLALKPGYSIFFGQVWFKDKVATIGTGLGLTDMVYPFVIAENAADAEELLRFRYEGRGDFPEIRLIKVAPGLNQDINRYIDPEKMTGFKAGALR